MLGLFALLVASSAALRASPAHTQKLSTDGTPSLTIPDEIAASAGGTVQVPITFDAASTDVSAIAFVLDYDQSLLTFDDTDTTADTDTLPDAIAFSLPAGFSGSVPDVDTTEGTISIFVGDLETPLSTLSDGTFATITLNVGTPTSVTSATVGFASTPPVSFGSTTGTDIPGTAEGGSVLITPDATPTEPTLSIASHSATGGSTVEVPVTFAANGTEVSAVAFVIDYDEAWLTLTGDDDDNDADDALDFSLPAGFSSMVPNVNPTAGTVSIFVGDLEPPMSALSDGPLVTLSFAVDDAASAANASVMFGTTPPVSFGSPQGTDIAGTVSGGMVQIAPGSNPDPDPDTDGMQLFLPMLMN
jgi:hypothetical protein